MNKYEFFVTYDCSPGLYSPDTEDIYHSVTGAAAEAIEKFIIPANIDYYLNNKSDIKVLDICYGIGYNSKSFLNFLLKNFSKNFKKNLKTHDNELSVNNDTIYSDNNSIYNEKIYTNKTLNKNEDKYNSEIYTYNNLNNIDNNKLHDIANNKKIFINAIDMDKNLSLLSPFIQLSIKNFDKFNKNIKNKKLKNLLEKYKNSDLSQNKKSIKNNLNNEIDNNQLNSEYMLIISVYMLYELADKQGDYLFSEDFRLMLCDRSIKPYLSPEMLRLYNLLYLQRCSNTLLRRLCAFLHNIYYMYLSKRYKIDCKGSILSKVGFNIKINDARSVLKADDNIYDIVFLDGFTPSKCPALWSYDFILLLAEHLSDDGVILTYTVAAPVRNAFIKSGLLIGNIFSSDNKSVIGTIASKNKSLIKYGLSEFDLGLIKTKSGIIYRDENLNALNEAILIAHKNDVDSSNLMSASQYKKHFCKP